MKTNILLLTFLLPVCVFATDFKFSDIPVKNGHPYYELNVPVAGAEKNQLFHQAQLFLAEYFKKTTPEIKIEDKEDGVLVARVTLSYNYLANPDILHGRSECLLHFKVENGICHISIYDFEIFHPQLEAGGGANMNYNRDVMPLTGHTVWSRQQEETIYKKAANDDRRALNEVKALHERVLKLEEALTKKLAN